MKTTRVVFLLPLAILLAMWLFHHPTNPVHAQSGQSSGPACCGEAVPHELDFAYYTLRTGSISTVTLVSASPQAFSFTIAVHGRSGQTVLGPSITIQPQDKLSVDLGQLLSGLAADVTGAFSDGSVAVYFKGTPTMLAGQLTMTNPTQSSLLRSLVVDNSPGLTAAPAALHTLWWGRGSGREALIRVANTSAGAVVLLDPAQPLTNNDVGMLASGLGGGISDPKAISLLAKLLHCRLVEVRRGAAAALRNTGNAAAIGPLCEALQDGDREVQYQAVIGLAEITGTVGDWAPSTDTFRNDPRLFLDHWREWARSQK